MQYSRLLKFITPHKRTLLMITALLLAGSVVTLVNPVLAGKLTELLLANSAEPTISVNLLLLAWFLLLLLRALIGSANSYLVATVGEVMSANLRSRVYEHMQALPLPWYQARKQGDILTLLSNDAESISRFVTNALVQVLPSLFTLVLAFLVITWLDPTVALIAALFLPAYTVVIKMVGRQIQPLSAAWTDSWSSLVAFVSQNLSVMPALKAFAREGLEKEHFENHSQGLLNVTRQQIRISAILTPVVGLMAGTGALILLWVGIQHVQAGSLTAPELVTLLLFVMLLTSPMSDLARVYSQTMQSRGAAQRLLAFFEEEPEPIDRPGRALQNVRGEIRFENIGFAYPGRPRLLDRFSLHIQPGETIALTGPNGSGKSTLAHLVMRFIEPDRGTILIDGIDIAEIELSSLRRSVGLVAQNTLLLNASIAENIAYGMPCADPSQVRKAAQAARADEFIQQLPNGYDTIIGDHGIRLSGGQQQRLSLARTLLKDPAILILDEATAMFDPEGEKHFIEACRELFRLRTVILITHRPASLALADRIIPMGDVANQTPG